MTAILGSHPADNGNTHSIRVCDSRSLLKVIDGEHINKSIRFNSTWTWATSKEKDELAKAAPALRIWPMMCEVVDPDGEVFKERKGMAESTQSNPEVSGEHRRNFPERKVGLSKARRRKPEWRRFVRRPGPHAEVDYLG